MEEVKVLVEAAICEALFNGLTEEDADGKPINSPLKVDHDHIRNRGKGNITSLLAHIDQFV